MAKLSVPSTMRSYSAEDVEHVVAVQPRLVQPDVDQRVDLLDRVARALGLGPADVGLPVDDLALQVRLVDRVELDDAERADAGRGQVHEHRRAETAGADGEHLGVLQPLLPVHADVRDDQVAAVPADLLDGEVGGGLHQGWQGHGLLLVSADSGPRGPAFVRTTAWHGPLIPSAAKVPAGVTDEPDGGEEQAPREPCRAHRRRPSAPRGRRPGGRTARAPAASRASRSDSASTSSR